MNNEGSFDDLVRHIGMEIEELTEEFIYRTISPFCETVVEKHLSKKELEKILRKGIQPSISLEKVKRAREELSNRVYDYSGSGEEITQAYCDGFKDSLKILDKLISESEEYDDNK